jgi:hypothetical protein
MFLFVIPVCIDLLWQWEECLISCILYWCPGDEKRFCIPVCIVLVLWQWEERLISYLHFILVSGDEKRFFCIPVCIVLVLWQWEERLISYLHFILVSGR